MPASVAQLISMLNQAKRDLPAIQQQGRAAAQLINEAATVVKAAGAGVPNPALAANLDAQRTKLLTAYDSVMRISPAIDTAAVRVQAAFRGRR